MARTINEIYQLIIQKKNNAIADYMATNNFCKNKPFNQNESLVETMKPSFELVRLKGEIEAYTDVLCLLESSGVVEDELIR